MSPSPAAATFAERLLRRERALVLAGIAVICGLCWYYLWLGAGTGMSPLAMSTFEFPPPPRASGAIPWNITYWLFMLCMWWAMMVAMMLPGAAPTLLLYARVFRHNRPASRLASPAVPTAGFLSGYLLAWLGFSLLATAAQWGLEQLGLLHRMLMWSSSYLLSAAVLLVAGAYQFTPAKRTCLRHCRQPASFLSRHWRSGQAGALRMGIHHGLYCVACCWAIMLLLFVGGVMNLVWIAGLALLVLLEKLLPAGEWLARAAGTAMLAGGAWLIFEWTTLPATG